MPRGADDRDRFDPVALGPFVVDFGAIDLQLPETGHEEEKDRDRGVLECGHLGGGKAGVVAELDLARLGRLIEMMFERGEAHGQRRSCFQISRKRREGWRKMRRHDNLEMEGMAMSLEIHKPELVQRVNAQIQSGHFHDADEPIETAIDALEGKTPASAAARRRAAGGKSLVEVFASLRGMNLNFGRNKFASRPVDLG